MRLFMLIREGDGEEGPTWDWVENAEPWTPEDAAQWDRPGRFGETWRPLNLRIVHEDRAGDFYGFNTHPIVTPRAWEAIRPVVGDSVEALPVRVVNGGPLLLLNVLDRVPLAAGTKTFWQGSPGLCTLIHKFVFRERDLRGKAIFRPTGPGVAYDHCIVADPFREAVLAGGLVGVDFLEINWHVDDLAGDLAHQITEPRWSSGMF